MGEEHKMANDLTNGVGDTSAQGGPEPMIPPNLSQLSDAEASQRLAAEQSTPAVDPQQAREEEAKQLAERGNDLLFRQTKAAEAAGTFSQALQLAPNLLAAHLGMAEANFALGQFPVTRMAAEYVLRLAPGTTDAAIAQGLLFCLDRRYSQALETLDQAIRLDPGRAYLHALRGYVFRCLHNDYDAALAEAKASRLAGSVDLRSLFPRVEAAVPVAPAPFAGEPTGNAPRPDPAYQPRPQIAPQDVARRRATQVRFVMRGYPVATYSIIAVCFVVFLLQQANPSITTLGEQDNILIMQGQWWRLFTVMFLHESWLHILTNMLSLYFIGPFVERIYGTGRYLILYFGTGLIASLTYLFLGPSSIPAVGASGAIAGIFGVLGAFFFAYRSQLGAVANSMLTQWAFWLGLNVLLNISDASGLAWQAHLGGLVSGLILGFFLAPKPR
jgi:rhomboid protease GluP